MTAHDRPSTAFWFATTVIVVVIASAYLFVARSAWQLGLRAAASFGIIMALLMVCVQSYQWHANWQRRRLERAREVADRLRGLPPPEQGMAVSVRRTLWDAMYEALMPRAAFPIDINEKRTYLRLDVHINLDWADRLRLLLCGQMRVLSTVYTDVEVKQCSTLSNVEVHPFTIKE